MAEWTGVGRYTVGITRALAARGDVEVVAAVSSSGAAILADDSIQTVLADADPLSPPGMWQLASVAHHVRPTLVHCLHFPTPLPVRNPLVVTLHDVTPLTVEGVMPSALRRTAYLALNRRAARVASAIITPSAFTARDVERLLPAAVGKTVVTGEGADDFASGEPGALPQALAELASEPYVLSMGSTRPHKDLPTLLRAFSRLAEEHADLRLLLVGEEVAGYLDASGLPKAAQSRIWFTGRVTDAELRSLYAGARVFVFPSLYEGFGLPPLEAMALGAPVVCANAASLPEVVGDAALMFSAGDHTALVDAVNVVLSDRVVRDELVDAGRERARQLTWASAASLTLAAYHSVL